MKKILFFVVLISLFACKKQSIDTPEDEKVDSLQLLLGKNNGLLDQGVPPETENVRAFSWVLQNQSLTDSIEVTAIKIELAGSPAIIGSIKCSESDQVLVPQTVNVFSVNTNLASGATKAIDITVKTLSNEDTLSAVCTVEGINKKTGEKFVTKKIKGQTIRIVSGSLGSVSVVTSSSFVSQYVACGDNGTTIGATKWVLQFRAQNSPITITELKFSTVPGSNITTVKVGNISSPVVANIAWILPVSIPVSAVGQSTAVEVLVAYSSIGVLGFPSGTMSSLSLIEIKYKTGDSKAKTESVTGITSPQMRSVGSKPTFSLFPSNQPLVVGENHIATVEVKADEKGDVDIVNIPLSLSVLNTTFGAGNLVVRDENNIVVPAWGTPAFIGNIEITFSSRFTIGAGQSKVLKIFVPVASVGLPGTASISTSLTPSDNLRWFDVKGGSVTAEQGIQFFYNWPTHSVSIRN